MNEKLWFLNTLVTVHVPHEQGHDGVSILESRAPRGDSPPMHVHGEDEIFHVLAGEMVVRVGDGDHRITAGQTLLAPSGVAHTYRVESEEASWLVVTSHGDFERFVRSFSRPATSAGLPEADGPPTPEEQLALAEACRRHGIELVGPPLG